MITTLLYIFLLLAAVGVVLWGIQQIPGIPSIVKIIVIVLVCLIVIAFAANYVTGHGFSAP